MKTRIMWWALGAALSSGVLCLAGCDKAGGLGSEALDKLQKAGGCDKVNREAAVLFERFGSGQTNRSFVILSALMLQDTPAISSLSDRVVLELENPPHPARLVLGYGSHRNAKVLMIYDPRTPPTDPRIPSFLQITTNIFVREVNP